MDTNIAQKIARAFVHGLAFAKGMTTLAQDAKAKMEEGDKWITIGAEPGDDGKKHGGRHALISGTGEVKAGLSKSAQGKPLGEAVKELKDKAESKKAEEKKSDRGETAREVGLRMQRAGKKAGERAAAKRTKAEIDRKEAMARAKEYRQETNQIVTNDLEPSVDKLKKSLAVRPLPSSVHYDLVYMHHLADQIGVMANKLCSLNSKWAENSKESSVFVVNIHGQNAKGTAERVAKLARQSAAIAQDFGKPNNERSYQGLYAHDQIRDNLSELRGLHQDLLDHIRRIQKLEKPSNSESDRVDAMYAQKGPKDERLINGPARANATQEPSVSREVPKSFDLSTKEIKDLTDKLMDYTDDRADASEFGRKLQDMANLSAEIDKMDKMDKRYLSSMGQHDLVAARYHLGLAAKAARAVGNYQWRGTISSLRTEITRRLNTANRLYQEAQTEIDSKYRRLGAKP